MALTTKSLPQLVSDLGVGWAANTSLPAPVTSGDPLLALFQTIAAQLLYIEGLVNQAYVISRASTATGADLDSWVADFGVSRLAAVFAFGNVTFGVNSARGSDVYVPVGSLVQIQGGAIQYAVVADLTNGNYVPGLGFKLAAGQLSVVAKIQATTAGVSGNATANQINQIASALPVDTVTNALAFTNGADAETDVALRLRFKNFINSLAKATKLAIQTAVQGVAGIAQFTLLENFTISVPPVALNSNFLIIADDDGVNKTLSTTAQQSIFNAVDAVRPFTVMFGSMAPTAVTATIAITVLTDPVYLAANNLTLGQVGTTVQTAIVSYANSLPIGSTLYINKVIEIAIDASPAVVSVPTGTTTINASFADLVIANYQVVKATAGTVTVATL